MSSDPDIDPVKGNFIEKLNIFESNHRSFINLIIKPLMTMLIFLAVGYYTLWMSTNYVKQDKFGNFVEKQIEADKRQDEITKTRFEVTQVKLETIINQQVAYGEQLKAYNQLLSNQQKQIDSLDGRVIYLERKANLQR
jgi:hypothetical protein